MAKIWAFTDPTLGLFYVRANDETNAAQTAANVTRDPASGSTQVATYRGPDGSYDFIKDIDDMQAGAQLYDARNGTAKWVGNWKKSSYSDWFKDTGNFKFTYEDTAANQAQGPNPGKDKINYSPLGDGLVDGDAGTAEDSLDFADPIAGFLKGLGFDFNQGAGAARDFQQRQGALGSGTFAAQEAANVFDNIGKLGPDMERLDTRQQFGANLGGWQNIGTRALENLKKLSNLGTQYDSPAKGATRKYFNPFNDEELDPYGIASQLSAALQGSGVSSLYNQGVNASDVQRMFTTFAGQNPTIANADTRNLDENFLKYAAGQFGLDRFF
jgi:hypothetical protein